MKKEGKQVKKEGKQVKKEGKQVKKEGKQVKKEGKHQTYSSSASMKLLKRVHVFNSRFYSCLSQVLDPELEVADHAFPPPSTQPSALKIQVRR